MTIKDLQHAFAHQLKVAAQELQWTPEEVAKYASDKPPITRNGDTKMAAPATIRNFAGTLRDHLKRATDRMEKMAAEFGHTVENLHSRLDETDALKKDVDTAAREIQEVIGTPNGGPPLEK